MRRLAALLAIAWLLASCAGSVLPCVGDEACLATDSCCDDSPMGAGQHVDQGGDADATLTGESDAPGPTRPTQRCGCCPQAPPVVPAMQAAHLAPAPQQVERLSPPADRLPSPSPQEILHVPKLAASFG